ncbi:hypothetical protein [Halosegnis longus]|uniref:hypothetical protein n=1 Tax=Halosegnis longus TaxID=2216012 RepID=UPI00129D7D8A|nr:hypothetical protein [Halosegnis longus]
MTETEEEWTEVLGGADPSKCTDERCPECQTPYHWSYPDAPAIYAKATCCGTTVRLLVESVSYHVSPE